MGWLDNSTNNIILDAVLTDYGRQALARNEGSFRVARFSLGDDEVDYGIITKYGRTVGREKIEKNTPVFEAFTNQNLGLKYRMISVPRPLLYLPFLSFNNNSTVIELSTTNTPPNNTFKDVTINQSPQGGETAIEPDLLETTFDVYVPDIFLSIDNFTPVGSPDVNKISLYTLSTLTSTDGVKLNFTLRLKPISSPTFEVYGRIAAGGTKKTIINTSIKAVGRSSGASLDIPVTITRT